MPMRCRKRKSATMPSVHRRGSRNFSRLAREKCIVIDKKPYDTKYE
jgi:hypothetical protein